MSIELIPPFFLFPWMPLPLPVHPPSCFSFWLAAPSPCSQDFDPNQPQKQMEDQKRVGSSMARTRDSGPQLEQHVSIHTFPQAAIFTNCLMLPQEETHIWFSAISNIVACFSHILSVEKVAVFFFFS